MHKKLGLVENNQIVENEVANFIHLGAKDFTEVGLRKLEKRIRAMLGQTGNSFKRKSSQRLSRAAEAVLSNRSKPSMSNISKASKTSRHSSVKTVTHSHKSQASGLSMTSRKQKQDPWGEILRFNAALHQEELRKNEERKQKQKELIKQELDR
jgi:hypothetical protein